MHRSRFTGISGSRSLVVRMVLVAVLTPVVSVGLLVAVAILLPSRWLFLMLAALAFGAVARIARARHAVPEGSGLTRTDDPELFDVVERQCALAQIPVPAIILRREIQPNSWVVHLPGKTPRLYVTTGLRALLTLSELSAVIAHELSHIANRDAVVMSVVDMPGSLMRGRSGFVFFGNVDLILMRAIGALSMVGTSSLSRYREFAADEGSAMITGRPSALASALIKVSESINHMPSRDLREAAKLNAFNLIEVRSSAKQHESRRLTATHPSLEARLAALAKLEQRLQNPR